MHQRVDVVIVTHNSENVVEKLLDSLPAACAGISYATVVVDNASLDGTRELVSSRSDCDLLVAANDGYASGINRGVCHLGGNGPILVLNPDLWLAPGSVPAMVQALERPHTGVVGPRVEDGHGQLVRSMRREPTLSRALGFGRTGHPALSEYVIDSGTYGRAQVVDWVLGAVVLVARDAYQALGGWDDSYFLYSEETDFCLRARDHGWRTRYEPTAQAMHIGAESGQSATTHSMQILNRVRLYGRRHHAIGTTAYLALTVLSEASWVVRGHRQSAHSLVALLVPSRRPPQLGLSTSFLPR